jgi:hypothetical protein
MDKLKDTVIEFKSAFWIKIVIPIGIIFFFIIGIGGSYGCFDLILEKRYPLLFVIVPIVIFMFYLCNMGCILFRYRNLKIEISNEKIRLNYNKELREYKWSDGLTIRDRSGFQVFEILDSSGKRLFMIDHKFPKFSLLATIINKKISNPKKDLTELIK